MQKLQIFTISVTDLETILFSPNVSPGYKSLFFKVLVTRITNSPTFLISFESVTVGCDSHKNNFKGTYSKLFI